MKNLIFVLLFLIFTLSASSQGTYWELRTGYGFYDLSNIKALQLELLKATSLPNMMAVEKFPDNIFYSVSVNHSMNLQNMVGFDFSYYTTGGRNHLKDYSGEYKSDMLINGYRIGTKYRNYNVLYRKLNFGVQVGGGLIFSNLNINEKLKVFDEVLTDGKYEFSSLGLYIEPSLILSYNLFKGTKIDFMCGYEKDFKGELHVKDNKNEKIGKSSDWSGLKISLGINYSFSFEKKGTIANNQELKF